MSTRFRLVLPRCFYDEMIEHARAERPNECCGLLAGARDGALARVSARYALVNETGSPTEYLSEPRSMFEAVRAIDRAGLEIVGVYHSHPTSEPVPSKKDLDQSYSPDVVNFIVSLLRDEPLVRAWWLDGTGYTQADWDLFD